MSEIPVLTEDWKWGSNPQAALFDDRPPYHIRSMKERAAIKPNGLTAVSTFSGCGGSSLGLRGAGFTIPYAVEFTNAGTATYLANSPTTFVDQRDIREILPAEILDRLEIQPGELDLFEGSPPCSSFSSAGTPRGGEFEETRGKVKLYSEGIKQATDDLFPEWIRILEGLRPKAFIAENVPDMLKRGEPQRFTFGLIRQLEDLGYEVHARVYSSLAVGCATMRRRLIFMGVRKDVGRVPRPVLTGAGYTVREALATLPIESPYDEDMWCRSDGTGTNPVNGRDLPRYAIAELWEKLEPGTFDEDRITLGRAHWDRPCPTFTAAGANPGASAIMHPDVCRKFTPTEIKWMSGFPADFILTGTPAERYERIARAVTPPLYEALSPYLARAIKGGR